LRGDVRALSFGFASALSAVMVAADPRDEAALAHLAWVL
jgi:hypothetical protein